ELPPRLDRHMRGVATSENLEATIASVLTSRSRVTGAPGLWRLNSSTPLLERIKQGDRLSAPSSFIECKNKLTFSLWLANVCNYFVSEPYKESFPQPEENKIK
ncbi:MAG: hypothetical protein WBC92_12735, partial [Terracidiphilus sp.]